ncbi:MAG: hypothetical protein JW829_15020, partial [Pirellulales bacterium]|nr:hypothetical protein [Pirellulales bacterium]
HIIDRESIHVEPLMIESWYCHHDPFEYEYEYRCTEYEYDCPDELWWETGQHMEAAAWVCAIRAVNGPDIACSDQPIWLPRPLVGWHWQWASLFDGC